MLAIALMGVTAIGLLVAAGAEGVDRLLTGVVLVDGVFFALTGLASVLLVRQTPHADRPVRLPGFPWVPLAFFAVEAAVVVGAWMDPEVRGAAFIGVAWIAATAVLYVVRFRGSSAPSDEG